MVDNDTSNHIPIKYTGVTFGFKYWCVFVFLLNSLIPLLISIGYTGEPSITTLLITYVWQCDSLAFNRSLYTLAFRYWSLSWERLNSERKRKQPDLQKLISAAEQNTERWEDITISNILHLTCAWLYPFLMLFLLVEEGWVVVWATPPEGVACSYWVHVIIFPTQECLVTFVGQNLLLCDLQKL